MADTVQYKLERMVNEFDDLERRGLFSHREIAEIVKQRRKFEYRLKRPSPLKQDFVAYIEYEKQLDALRLLRKKAVSRELKKKGDMRTKSDYAGVSRIMEIYRLATNRFKSDIELWFQYLEFCRERGNGRMNKVLAQVMRFHPKVPGVWIYAAAWEFDHQSNVEAARALMLDGLRACPTSEDLWVEYLRMELTFFNKLQARKVYLGEDKGMLIRDPQDADEKLWRDENRQLYMAIEETIEDDEALDVQNGESMKSDLLRERVLSIFQAVYSGAVEALPSSFSLRTRFFEILEAIDLSNSDEMCKEILAEMKRDFSKETEYWDWLARLDSKGTQEMVKEIAHSQLGKAIQVYEEAIKAVPSAMMFNLYAGFLKDFIAHKKVETQSSGLFSTSDHAIDPISHILMVYERAESMGCATEDLACQHIAFYLQLGKLEEARKLTEKLCAGELSDGADLWVLRFSIEISCVTKGYGAPSKVDLRNVFELLKNVLTEMAVLKAERLWLLALKFFSNQRHYMDKLVELSLVSLAKNGGSDDGFSLSSAIINLVLQKDGIQSTRNLYKRFLALPHPGLAIYKTCIELETNIASAGDKNCLPEARKLYEYALATYNQDVTLWRSYYSMEIKMGTSETANAVYWRARKSLKDNVALFSSGSGQIMG